MATFPRCFHRLLSVFRSGHAEADLAREVEAHLRLLEDAFLTQGMSSKEAHAAARRAFGGVDQTKERQRDARSFRWLDCSWLDFKLGARMLIKYPGLTLIGGAAIATGIAFGAASFEAVTQVVYPRLPLDEGHRIVGIRNWTAAARSVEPRAIHDFIMWRQQLEMVEDIGAFRTLERNLITDGGSSEPVEVAEISAAAFRLARVPALLGRYLDEADEQPAALPVAVIGHDVWQRLFGGDRSVIGRMLRLGSMQTTVVGVMPKGFAFPVAHSVWVPLQLSAFEYGRRRGPEIQVFGRLRNGNSLAQARAAATAIGLRAAANFPDTHAQLRPEILPYARSIVDVSEFAVGGTAVNLFVVMFLVLVCTNVAALIFARAVMRENEIVVRNALGASRGRIVMQLFMESLALGGVAAVIGLAAAAFTLRWWLDVFQAEAGGRLPFWLNSRLSFATVLYTGLLTVLGAAVAGVAPALKVTGRHLQGRLRHAAAGGTDLKFGGLWTVVIVAQVAVTVGFPVTAFFARRHVTEVRSLDVGFPRNEYLTMRFEMDQDATVGTGAEATRASRARVAGTYDEFERRLAAEPAVVGVTFANTLPGTTHRERRIEIEGQPAAESGSSDRVNSASVAINFFDVLDAAILSGRGFHSSDLGPGARVVIVNRSFIDQVLGGRNPIGRRIRYAGSKSEEPSAWYEIVGTVKDLGMIHDNPRRGAGLYHPAAAGDVVPLRLAVHVSDPSSSPPRIRAVAAEVDPTLRLHELMPLEKAGATMWLELDFLFRLLVLVSAVALLLSLTGIYSVMSFTVSRRKREIGIRVALGAGGRHIVATIFTRAFAQVALGIVAGGCLVFALTKVIAGLSRVEVAMLTAYIVLMMTVCTLACIVPIRRALGIQPTEVIRADS